MEPHPCDSGTSGALYSVNVKDGIRHWSVTPLPSDSGTSGALYKCECERRYYTQTPVSDSSTHPTITKEQKVVC